MFIGEEPALRELLSSACYYVKRLAPGEAIVAKLYHFDGGKRSFVVYLRESDFVEHSPYFSVFFNEKCVHSLEGAKALAKKHGGTIIPHDVYNHHVKMEKSGNRI